MGVVAIIVLLAAAAGAYELAKRSTSDSTTSGGSGISKPQASVTIGSMAATPVTYEGIFTPTGSMSVGRGGATATLLPDGDVLIAGGLGGQGALATAELYNPTTGASTLTGSMTVARFNATATLLPDGRVLIAGGDGNPGQVSSAELYDPRTGTFSPTGSMSVPRQGPTATLLPDGQVLIAGGWNDQGVAASAELYDPTSGTFEPTGSMSVTRIYATATLLPSGQVLVAGGWGDPALSSAVSSAELYNPTSGIFSLTGPMAAGRALAAATLLPNGRVLLVGGWSGSAGSAPPVPSAELYDPTTGMFTLTGSMLVSRGAPTATLLPKGGVLVAGGWGGPVSSISSPTPSAELFR